MPAKRKVSDAYITKVWEELRSISRAAKRVGMSYVGIARRLHKLGFVRTKTARSR
jgi:hypothetical protein